VKSHANYQQQSDEKVPEVEPGLSYDEIKQVHDSRRLRAAVVYEIIRTEGEGELRRGFPALWWSGLAAGISIGFSILSQAALASHLPDSAWKTIIAELGYTVGFLIVILGRQQLFTENTLTAVLPVVTHRKPIWFAKVLRLWLIVLIANLVGCLLFAFAVAKLGLVSAGVEREMIEIVAHLMENSKFQMFAKGIGAGWIIAALVWMLPSSEGAEFSVIFLMTYIIALCGFTHVIAGSAEALYGWIKGMHSIEHAATHFFLPTLAGNVFGGTALFAVLSYAQVREEISENNGEL
jgi:formate-nitrite transporter family protein